MSANFAAAVAEPLQSLGLHWLRRSRCCGSTGYLARRSHYRAVNVTMQALWFDENKRKNFAYSRYQRRFLLMNERELERLIHLLHTGEETA
jgi:hypothetical protein